MIPTFKNSDIVNKVKNKYLTIDEQLQSETGFKFHQTARHKFSRKQVSSILPPGAKTSIRKFSNNLDFGLVDDVIDMHRKSVD